MVHGVAESDMTEHLSTEHIYLVTFGCAGSLLLHQFSLAVDSGGYSLIAVLRHLITVASLLQHGP